MQFSSLAMVALLFATGFGAYQAVYGAYQQAVYDAYQNVIKQVTSGDVHIGLPQTAPVVSGPIDWSKFQVGLPAGMSEDIKRYNAQNIASQIRDSERRMEDMAAYTRNPAGWHGPPPH